MNCFALQKKCWIGFILECKFDECKFQGGEKVRNHENLSQNQVS